jgi:hypothetical protein
MAGVGFNAQRAPKFSRKEFSGCAAFCVRILEGELAGPAAVPG